MAPKQASGRLAQAGHDLKLAVGRALRRAGVDPMLITHGNGFDARAHVVRAVEPFTMTSPERIAAVCQATSYVVGTRSRATSSSAASGAEAR